jgi:anti-sigma regulatory factor (Ser/Thr protein kinase)
VVSDGSLADAQLLVSELITNGVRHGKMGADERIELAAELDRDAHTLFVEVRHPGAGFEPRQRGGGDPVDSNWGLHILQQLAGSWGVSGDGATSVWFTIPTDRPTEA